MHIAVVIAAFNAASFLAGAIESVLRQTHTVWSLAVIDDGSADDTHAIAAGYADPRIRVIQQPNGGVSSARNAGIAAFSGGGTNPDAFLFLDSDDWLAPCALATLSDTLAASPWAVAAFGRYARADTTGRVRTYMHSSGGHILEALLTRNLFANGGHVLIGRDALDAAGLFRTDLSFGEDWEFWVRLALLGEFAAVRAAGPLLFVREHPASVCARRAADPASYRPALRAIHGNQDVIAALGPVRMAALSTRAEAEIAWTVGREIIRHGDLPEGRRWLWRSIGLAPGLKRLLLALLSHGRIGPFRPYAPAKYGIGVAV
jgi:glycosyltransferase involved in cell wall biosynthesis